MKTSTKIKLFRVLKKALPWIEGAIWMSTLLMASFCVVTFRDGYIGFMIVGVFLCYLFNVSFRLFLRGLETFIVDWERRDNTAASNIGNVRNPELYNATRIYGHYDATRLDRSLWMQVDYESARQRQMQQQYLSYLQMQLTIPAPIITAQQNRTNIENRTNIDVVQGLRERLAQTSNEDMVAMQEQISQRYDLELQHGVQLHVLKNRGESATVTPKDVPCQASEPVKPKPVTNAISSLQVNE